ncbi:glutaredoxin family protein [Candidatus Micrarchaeota archaeon]|nr:glutaredoxin family protein [Candidatus Micrarchaeota archaeon]
MAAHSVTIYSTPSCVYCKLAKSYFKEKNIEFKEIDVAADQQKAEEMIEKSGQLGVPVIEIDDQVIVGFDKPKIQKALGLTA